MRWTRNRGERDVSKCADWHQRAGRGPGRRGARQGAGAQPRPLYPRQCTSDRRRGTPAARAARSTSPPTSSPTSCWSNGRALAPDAEVVSIAATSVGAGLHNIAETRGADLIVLGSCHRSAGGRIFAGDDARSIVHHAPCAVVVAPAGYASRRPDRDDRRGLRRLGGKRCGCRPCRAARRRSSDARRSSPATSSNCMSTAAAGSLGRQRPRGPGDHHRQSPGSASAAAPVSSST